MAGRRLAAALQQAGVHLQLVQAVPHEKSVNNCFPNAVPVAFMV
jgi:hypothetical protein